MDEHHATLDAHVVIVEGRCEDADAIKEQIKTTLSGQFGIEHTTLDMECARHICDAPTEFGGRVACASGV